MESSAFVQGLWLFWENTYLSSTQKFLYWSLFPYCTKPTNTLVTSTSIVIEQSHRAWATYFYINKNIQNFAIFKSPKFFISRMYIYPIENKVNSEFYKKPSAWKDNLASYTFLC